MRSVLLNKNLWALTLGHFTVDVYSGAMPVVMLFLTSALKLSVEQVGTVFALYSLCSSLSQPLFGYMSDRWGGRLFVAGGVLWMAVFQGLVGYVSDYYMLLLVAPLAGFGAASFHPHGASSANNVSGDKKTAGVAIFMLGGNGGFAFGPLLAAVILGGFSLLGWVFNFGLQGTAVMAILGIVLTPILFMLTPNFTRKKNTASPNTVSNKQGFELNKAFTGFAILSLLLVMSVRAWTQSAVSSFVPLFFTQEGSFTIAEASRISFLVSIGIMVGSLASGFIADRVGGRIVIFLAFLATAPMTFLLFWPKGDGAELIAPILGFVAGAGWPPMLVMSQELLPKNAGVASGLSLGFVFAMGGVGTWITGILAEPHRLGLYNSLVALSALPIIAAFLTLALPTQEAIVKAARASLEPSTPTQVAEPASD
jgi:FSR family fosmidomycin resistance protein-like MFS transporter